jgi:ubiquinone/menaquinone biosynthesis C-methylase UbiE
MLRKALRRLIARPRFRGRFWRWWYNYLERRLGDRAVWFLNYGYEYPPNVEVALPPQFEPHRDGALLYHAAAGALELEAQDVLEISCGRGGGARFVKAAFQPRLLVALDMTHAALAYCDAQTPKHDVGLLCGSAMSLPIADRSFDVVLNVEASHCYPDQKAFLREVHRVLKPTGHFIYVDIRMLDRCTAWREALGQAGFSIVEEEDISRSVLQALHRSSAKRESLVRASFPRVLRRFARRFAGCEDSEVYQKFASGELCYLRFVLRKETATNVA